MSDSSGRVAAAFHPWEKSKVTNILKHCLKIITQQVKKKKGQLCEILVNEVQRKIFTCFKAGAGLQFGFRTQASKL